MRKITLTNGEYYHVFCRGVDGRVLFSNDIDYLRVLWAINNLLESGYVTKPIIVKTDREFRSRIKILCYCFMPTHYHLLIQQLRDKGITDFMHQLTTSYAKYYNVKNHRTGRLFESTFKTVHVVDEVQLLHLSRYIHLNPLMAHIATDISNYRWSSYKEYISENRWGFCQTEDILSQFKTSDKYRVYSEYVMDYVTHKFDA